MIEDEYAAWASRISSSRRGGISRGFDVLSGVLARLGHPELKLGRVIQIGGTNGKGSTAQCLAALLRSRGRKVGLYTSPHLTTIRERITINAEMISKADIIRLATLADRAGATDLTFFEQLTTIALLHFAEQTLDDVILEVGLGGRLDSTTVVPANVGLVTGVAFDHEQILGATLAEIANEKAGIFRPGRAAIIGRSGLEEGRIHLLEAAARIGALPIIDVPTTMALPPLGLTGEFQNANARNAVTAFRYLVDDKADVSALASVKHPGRFERLPAPDVELFVDGAHNPHAAAALATAIASLPRPLALVIAVASDKDVRAMLAPLLRCADAVFATQFPSERSLDATSLGLIAKAMHRHVETMANPFEAIDVARRFAKSILVTGSLMLVGHVRGHWLGLEADPLPLSDPSLLRR